MESGENMQREELGLCGGEKRGEEKGKQIIGRIEGALYLR